MEHLLPPEIWVRIIKHVRQPLPPPEARTTWSELSQTDLISLMQVNSTVYEWTWPILYSTAVVQNMSLLLYGAPLEPPKEPHPLDLISRKDRFTNWFSILLFGPPKRKPFPHPNRSRLITSKAKLLKHINTLHIVYHLTHADLGPDFGTRYTLPAGEYDTFVQSDHPKALDWQSCEYMMEHKVDIIKLLGTVQNLGLGTWDDGTWPYFSMLNEESWTVHETARLGGFFVKLLLAWSPKNICRGVHHGPLSIVHFISAWPGPGRTQTYTAHIGDAQIGYLGQTSNYDPSVDIDAVSHLVKKHLMTCQATTVRIELPREGVHVILPDPTLIGQKRVMLQDVLAEMATDIPYPTPGAKRSRRLELYLPKSPEPEADEDTLFESLTSELSKADKASRFKKQVLKPRYPLRQVHLAWQEDAPPCPVCGRAGHPGI